MLFETLREILTFSTLDHNKKYAKLQKKCLK